MRGVIMYEFVIYLYAVATPIYIDGTINSYIYTVMFLAKNINMLTLLGVSQRHSPFTIKPPLLNKHSKGTLVPHIHKYFLVRTANAGKLLASCFHQIN